MTSAATLAKAKHTPGPWCVERKVEVYGPSRGFGSEPICDCGEGEVVRAECEANARLIAAAPDLLEILKPFIEIWDRGGHDYADKMSRYWGYDNLSKARAILAKADGAQ